MVITSRNKNVCDPTLKKKQWPKYSSFLLRLKSICSQHTRYPSLLGKILTEVQEKQKIYAHAKTLVLNIHAKERQNVAKEHPTSITTA